MKQDMDLASTGSMHELLDEWTPDVEPKGDLASALTELEEATARIVSLRHKVERLAAGISERRDVLRRVEHELSVLRASADHDHATISRLQRDLEGREELLAHLRTDVTGLATELGLSREEQ